MKPGELPGYHAASLPVCTGCGGVVQGTRGMGVRGVGRSLVVHRGMGPGGPITTVLLYFRIFREFPVFP